MDEALDLVWVQLWSNASSASKTCTCVWTSVPVEVVARVALARFTVDERLQKLFSDARERDIDLRAGEKEDDVASEVLTNKTAAEQRD